MLRAQVRHYYFVGLHPIVAMRWDPKLCSRGVSEATKVGPPSTPIPKALEPHQELMIPPGVLPMATPEAVVLPPREANLVHVLALMTGSCKVKPSVGLTPHRLRWTSA